MKNILNKFLAIFLVISIILSLNTLFVFADTSENIISEEAEYTQEYIDYLENVDLAGSEGNESEYPEGALPPKYVLPYADLNEVSARATFPERYFSKYVTSVKNQGSLGTCWNFAATANLESALMKKLGMIARSSYIRLENFDSNLTSQYVGISNSSNYDFSEQHLRYSISDTSGNTLGYNGRTSTQGGWYWHCLNYWTRGKLAGPVLEEDDPYIQDSQRDLSITESKVPIGYYVSDTITLDSYINDDNKINIIKKMIQNYGSLDLGYYKSNQAELYNGKYHSIYVDGSGNGGHSVLIVGWDDNFPIEYFNGNSKGTKNGAFIIKNSWGTGAGDNGFYYISYDCVSKLSNLFTVENIQKSDFHDTIYEYDQHWNSNFAYGKNTSQSNKLAYYNIFNKKDNKTEYLTAVSGHFFSGNNNVKLYYSKDGDPSNFVNLKAKNRMYTINKNNEYVYHLEYGGYKTFILDEPIKIESDNFAIGFEVENEDGTTVKYPYESTNIVAGKSYILQDINSQPTVLTDRNVAVKAFTYHTDHTWNFGDDIFDNYAVNSTMATNRVIDGLSFNCGTWGDMEFSDRNDKINKINYSRRLSLKGEGNTTERSLNFKVFGDSDIYITAKSTSDAERPLRVANKYGGTVDTITVNSELKTYPIKYVGGTDDIYLYSEDSGIYIYSISVKKIEENQYFSKEWNFDSSEFNNFTLSTNNSKTINGLTILKDTDIKEKYAYINGQGYNKYLSLSGAGNNYKKGVRFDVNGECCLQIIGNSSGSDNRDIEIIDQNGNVIGTFVAEPKVKTQTFLYEGGKNTLYIHSTGGGAYIYSLVIAVPDVLDENDIIYEDIVNRENEESLISAENTASLYSINLLDNINTSGSSIELNFDAEKIRAYINSVAEKTNQVSAYNFNDTEVSENNSYYYNQITSDKAKEYYNLISEAVLESSSCKNMLKIDLGVVDDFNGNSLRKDMRTALGAFLCDNPEIFWLKTYGIQFKTYTYNQKRWIYGANIYLINKDENVYDSKILTDKENIQNKIDTILSGYNKSDTEFYRYSYLIEELRKINTRTEDVRYKNRSDIKGFFIDGYSDSKGVAKAFKVLCDKANMPCIYAEGTYEGKYCAWNYIKINEQWYICNIYLNNYMIPLIDSYKALNPTIYGDNSNNTQIFKYPVTASERFMLKWGDCDNNGYVVAADASIALSVGVRNEADLWHIYTLVNGDVDGNGILNAADANIILNFVLTGQKPTGLSSYFENDPLYELITMDIEASEDISNSLDVNSDGTINIYDLIETLNDMSK